MKVLITTLNSKYSHINIALYYLKKSIKNLCECSIENFTVNDSLNKIMEKVTSHHADMICFGCYIWNIEQTLKLAESIKKIFPHVIIALGGPEVSYNSKEILEKYPFISSIMCGEGENSIKALITDAIKKDIKPIYSLPVFVQDIPRIADDILSSYDNRVVYFETSRGCPYRCAYCLSCIDKNIKYFPIESVKEDLKKLLAHDVKQIRFLDRTFNSNRKRALELWEFMLAHRKHTTFHFEICANLIDEETLQFLKKVPKDTFQFEIGVQSTNQTTLEAINRAYHFDYESAIIDHLKKYTNIKLHTDLIIGLPFETYSIFQKSFNDLYSLHPHEIQLGFLKFLKGTDIYTKQKEHEYQFNSYPPFEVLQNRYLTYEEITYLKNFETVFEMLYNSGYFKNSLFFIETYYQNHYFTMYRSLTDYFIENGYLDRKISIEECFQILYHFFTKETRIHQALTYDYFLKFNGTRDWQYHVYSSTLKEDIQSFVKEKKETLFKNLSLSEIYKHYKFCILDYNFYTNTVEKTVYYTKK